MESKVPFANNRELTDEDGLSRELQRQFRIVRSGAPVERNPVSPV